MGTAGVLQAADAIPEELLSIGRPERPDALGPGDNPGNPNPNGNLGAPGAGMSPNGTQTSVPTEDAMAVYALQRLHVTQKFDCPVAMAVLPGESPREVVMQQRGEVWVLPKNEVVGDSQLFLDFREQLKGAYLFEEGFHGLAFHPKYTTNGKFYISYSTTEPRRTVISEMECLPGQPLKADPTSERVLLELPHPMANHFAGGLAFGPDGMLYIAIGDGGCGMIPTVSRRTRSYSTGRCCGSMWMSGPETSRTAFPRTTLLWTNKKCVLRFGRLVSAIRGALALIRRGGSFGSRMWGRTFGRRSISSKKVRTMAGATMTVLVQAPFIYSPSFPTRNTKSRFLPTRMLKASA
nr:PQQ-dependent sugar dehydrogenase [Verrucomicrobium spinosum]